MSDTKSFTAEELTTLLRDLPRPEKIKTSWLQDDPTTRIILITYPEVVSGWDEYYSMIEDVTELSKKAREEGLLKAEDKIAIVHMPLEAQMPPGSPVPPLKKALLEGEAAGMGLVVMIINNPFANFVTNRIGLPAMSFSSMSRKRAVATIEAAAKELANFN